MSMIYMEKSSMNELKLFDKAQLLLSISAIVSFLLGTVFFFAMQFTSQTLVNEEGVSQIFYNPTLQGLYSFFIFAHLLAIVWFVARLITYQLRKKEEMKEN